MNQFVIMAICCAAIFLAYAAIKKGDIYLESIGWITIVIFVITFLAGFVANQFFGVTTWVVAHFVTWGFLLMCVGCFISGLQGFLAGDY